MKQNGQMSDSLLLGSLLALSGGFMDAYTYICRGEVFANAQTGNILLFGVHLSEGDFPAALRYLLPVLSFVAGIFISEVIRYGFRNKKRIHWRQIAVLLEALIFCLVAFVPQSANLLANSLVSFACGIQVQSFRKIHGNGLATTMCIGNLRAATHSFCTVLFEKDKKGFRKAALYYGVIAVFAVGAVLGNAAVKQWAEQAILASSVCLSVCFFMMFRKEDGRGNKA